jgi:hypothetical protein
MTIDLFAIHFAGGRITSDRSYAMPARCYRDPAQSIKYSGEIMAKPKQQDQEAFEAMTPYGKLLTIWTRFYSLSDIQHTNGDSNPQDTKDFMRTGEAVDAMINNLPRHQWWAIRKSRGICTAWNFPSIRLETALEQAEEAMTPKMKIHVACARYFY